MVLMMSLSWPPALYISGSPNNLGGPWAMWSQLFSNIVWDGRLLVKQCSSLLHWTCGVLGQILQQAQDNPHAFVGVEDKHSTALSAGRAVTLAFSPGTWKGLYFSLVRLLFGFLDHLRILIVSCQISSVTSSNTVWMAFFTPPRMSVGSTDGDTMKFSPLHRAECIASSNSMSLIFATVLLLAEVGAETGTQHGWL